MNSKKYPEIRTGVIGVGSMGKNHARVFSEISKLVGVSDLNETQGNKIANKFNTKFYTDEKCYLKDDFLFKYKADKGHFQ